ncbi:MAG: BNR-4 repeat-containing protein [Verrucomicrobiota bacterium]|nr:BNR-4 repeat-containing protein [Verrucomicrobiota bacterium]
MRTIFLSLTALALFAFSSFAQTNLAVLTSDGAWTWYNDPRALFHNGILYFGYVRSGDGRSALSAFNPQNGISTELWSSILTQRDDHNNPGLLVKEDGTMLAIHARHGSDQFFSYRLSTSTNPVTPSDWTSEQTISSTGAGVTYANPYQLSVESGRVYNFMRDLNFNPTVVTSTNGGSSWSAPQLFIKNGTGNIRPYMKYASDYNQRIDFLYTDGHPRDITNSLYHLYYQNDGVYKTDGTLLKSFSNLPLQHDLGERGSVIYQYSDLPTNDPDDHIPTGRAWCWETAYQTNGNPVSVFTVQRDQVTGTNWFDDRIYYYYARWTGTNWQKRFIAHAGRPLYQSEDDYAGGVCVDPQNPNTIYISSNAQNPFDLSNITNVTLRANNRYEIYRGVTTNGGLNFSWQAVTTNSAVDNLRPYIPRRQQGTPAVIWFRGTYATFTSYTCEVVGLFPNPIPPVPPALSLKITSPSLSPIALTNLNNELKLRSVASNGLPQVTTLSWTTISGPTNAVFSNPNSFNTTARFSTNGIYVLRATAGDTFSVSAAELTVSAGTPSPDGLDPLRSLWLKLDETSGMIASDSSGSGNQGALSGGATWRPSGGVRNGAIEFDGASGQVIVPDADMLDNTAAFTLAYWFFAKTFPGDSAGLVSKRNSISDNNAYTTYLKNDRRIYVDIDSANNRFSSSTLFNTGQWYHVAVTFDGAATNSERVKFWVNGNLDVTAPETSASIPNYNSTVRIGNTHPNALNWFNGFMDDIRFYRRALSSEEIVTLSLKNFAATVFTGVAPSVTNGISAALNGSVVAGSSTNLLTTFWGKLFGPGNPTFANALSPTTSVTFQKSGTYTLQLSASDGQIEVAQNLPLNVIVNTNVFDDWTTFVFSGETNSSIVGATADPDGDGVVNFTEFALGMNPKVKDAAPFQTHQPGLPIGKIINISGTNYLAMLLKRPIGRLSVNYNAQASTNLQSWLTINPGLPQNNGDSTETLTYVDPIPVMEAPQGFIRANLTQF